MESRFPGLRAPWMLLLALTLWGTLATAATPDEIRKLLAEGKYAQAEKELAPLLAVEKPSSEVLQLATKAYADQAKFFTALKHANRVFEVDTKPAADFLFQAGQVSEATGEYNLAVSRYRAFTMAVDKKHPKHREGLANLIRVQVLLLKSPEVAGDGQIRFINDYGFDPIVHFCALRTLDALRNGGNSAYYELLGKVFEVAPEKEQRALLNSYWDTALNKQIKYRSEPHTSIAAFLTERKVKDALYAEEILKNLVTLYKANNPTETIIERRLEEGRRYGSMLLSVTPVERWSGPVVSMTVQGYLLSSDVAVKNEGLKKFAELDAAIWKSNNETLYRAYLTAITRTHQIPTSPPPPAAVVEALHKYVAKLGPATVQDEILGLYQLRQFVARETLKDQQVAGEQLLTAIKLTGRRDFLDRYFEMNPTADVMATLAAAKPASRVMDYHASLMVATTVLNRQKNVAGVDQLTRAAIEFLPHDFLAGNYYQDTYAGNTAIADEVKVKTLSELLAKYPDSAALQQLADVTVKWFQGQKKDEPAKALQAARQGAAGDKASPWAGYAAFMEAARAQDAGKYSALLGEFIKKHNPVPMPMGEQLTPANIMGEMVAAVLPWRQPSRLDENKRIEALLPHAASINLITLADDLVRKQRWDDLKKHLLPPLQKQLVTRTTEPLASELSALASGLLDRYLTAANNSRDWAALNAIVTAIQANQKLPANFRLNLVAEQLLRLARLRDKDLEQLDKFVKDCLQAQPAAAWGGSPAAFVRVLDAYRETVNVRPAVPAVVQLLGEAAKLNGITASDWQSRVRSIARANTGPVRDTFFKEALATDLSKLDAEARRVVLFDLFELAPADGWDKGLVKDRRNEIGIGRWLPVERAWLKTTNEPFEVQNHPWRMPWEHAWNYYRQYANGQRQLQAESRALMVEMSYELANRLPVLQGSTLEMAQDGLAILANGGEPAKLAVVIPVVAGSIRAGNSADYLKSIANTLADNDMRELAGVLLVTAQRANPALPEDARRTAEILLADLGKDLGIYRIPVDRRAPEYDLYLASQTYVFGDRGRALDLFLPKSKLLVDHWHNLNPEFVIFGLNSMRRQGAHAEALDACFKILLNERYLTPDMTANISLTKGDIYKDQEKFDAALAEYKSLLANTSLVNTRAGTEAQFRMLDVLRLTKNYDAAQPILERLQNRTDADLQARAFYYMALFAYDQKDWESTEEFLGEVFKRRASDTEATILQAQVDVERKKYYKATDLELGTIAEQKSVVPGRHLRLSISDPNLGIARANDAIPVIITTSSGKDREMLKLRAKEGNRSVFEDRIITRLGKAEPGNTLLEVSGSDTVSYTIDPEFQKANNLNFSTKELVVVSPAVLAASSGEFIADEERKRRELEQETADPEDLSKRDTARDNRTIRPGNFIYVQVKDEDRDTSGQPDKIMVKLETTSGDLVERFEMTETGPYTGLFQGQVPTAKPLPKASASDSAEGKDPGWTINQKQTGVWNSLPDGLKPKWYEVDLQNPASFQNLSVDFVDRNVQRLVLLGTQYQDDYEVLAEFPNEQEPYKGGLTVRALLGKSFKSLADTRLALAQDVTFIGAANTTGFKRDAVHALSNATVDCALRMQGWFVLDKMMRLSLQQVVKAGTATASVLINGDLVVMAAGKPANVTLGSGVHHLEILLQGKGTNVHWELQHLNDKGEWKLLPPEWFSLKDHPELAEAAKPKASLSFDGAKLLAAINTEQRFRKFRLAFKDYTGESIKISKFTAVDRAGATILPGQSDFSEARQNQVLELSAGDQINVTYADAIRLDDKRGVLTESLSSSYFDGQVSLDLEQMDQNRKATYFPVKRVALGDNLMIRVEDWDMDVSDQQDTVKVQVVVANQPAQVLTALETEKHSGVYLATVKFRAEPGPDTVVLKPGAEILIKYFDEENTKPGTATDRTYKVFEAGNIAPEIVPLQTSTSWELVVDKDAKVKPGEEPRKVLRRQVLVTYTDPNAMAVIPAIAPTTTPAAAPAAPAAPAAAPAVPAAPGAPAAPAAPAAPEAAPAEAAPEAAPVAAVAKPMPRAAVDAPVMFFIRSPSTARNELSTIQAKVFSKSVADAATAAGTEPEKLLMTLRLTPVSALAGSKGYKDIKFLNMPDAERLEMGLFAGIVRLQLGKPGDAVNNLVITPEAAYGTVGGAGKAAGEDQNTVPTIIVKGKDQVTLEIEHEGQVISQTIDLFCEGTLNWVDRDFEAPKTGFYLGEPIYLRVVDLDLDKSEEYDICTLTVSSSGGDKLSVELRETLPHSGVFTGAITPKYRAKEEPVNAADQILGVHFGEEIIASYEDLNHSRGLEPIVRSDKTKVHLGSDGTVNTFSKRFKDEEIAVRTAFTIAEAYFELAKEHRKLAKEELATEEINIGKKLLEEAMSAFPNTPFAAQAEYLLANLAQETERYDEAIGRYSGILNQWPDSDYAPKAQFKLGLCYEKMTPPQWDEACEEYVKITYKYPDNPLVADVIIRLGQYFWRLEQYETAGDVFKSFQKRFGDHKLSSRALLLAGQSYIKAKLYDKAIKTLDELINGYVDDKEVRPEAMYWLADSFMKQKDNTSAYKTFKKLTWDYPETKWAKMARGRLVEDVFRTMGEKL